MQQLSNYSFFYTKCLQFVGFHTGSWGIAHSCGIKINTQVYYQILLTLIPLLPTNPGWESSAWCPSVTPWPLLALQQSFPCTVGRLSPDQAWGQTFWEVRGRGMRWWCHFSCRRGASRDGGWAVSRVPVTHWVYCSLLAASRHPMGNRAPFDGFKQSLMTRTHLIRLTRSVGRGGKTREMMREEQGKDPRDTRTRIDCEKLTRPRLKKWLVNRHKKALHSSN